MSNKTNFSPDGNLFVKGGLTSESFLDVTGDSTFGGNVTITGSLQASGNITFLNDTQTVNAADGYVINSDSDVATAYLQVNSDVSNIRLTYNTNTATIGYSGITDEIELIANTLTLTGLVNTSGDVTFPNANITGNLNVVDEVTIGGDITMSNTAQVINIGSNVLSSSRFTGVANTADKWHTTRNIGVSLTGDVTGDGNVDIDGTGNVTVNVTTTTVGPNAVALGTDTSGQYVRSIQGVANANIQASAHSGDDGQDITIDLVDLAGATPGTYGNATHHMVFELDGKGRVSNVAPVSANISSSQVYNFQSSVRGDVSASTGLTYNSSTGVFNITNTSVTAGSYGNATTIPTFTVNAQGQLTAAADVSIAIPSSQVTDFNSSISNYISNGTYVTESAGTLDVTSAVVATDRDATLAGDYTFTGNVNLSNASVTDANVAHLGGVETFTGAKTFSADVTATANVDLTGAVVTATTQANSDQTTKVATTQYVENRIAGVLGDAPAALDTLGEIANALIDDANIGNVLTASIANVESNTIFKQGNVAMTGDLDLGSNKVVSVADPTAAQDAATKSYTDDLVDTANTNLKTYVDDEKVDKDFELQASYAFKLSTKLANGSIVAGDDSSLSNPNSANNAISFNNTDETQNIFIGTTQYGHRYAVLHQGAQGSGELVPSQERSGNLTVTGDLLLQRGIDGNANVGPEFNGAGTFTSVSNMRHVKSANATFAAGQSFTSNVQTLFYKNEIGSLSGNTGKSAMVISGSNLFVVTGNSDTVDTYLGSESSGTISSVSAYSNTEIGVPRAHYQNFGKSTIFLGDFDNVSTYTNVFDLDTSNIYTTGGRPLERLTVDGAISLGARHTPANLLVNGTIFYEASTNKLKGVQGNAVVDLVDATVTTLNLGDGTGEYQLASLSGNTYYIHQLTVGDGITDSIDASNVISISVDDSYIVGQARGSISSGSANLGYNENTGVITHSLTTTDITEGDNLYYTDTRFDSRLQTRNVGNLADVDTTGASNGQVLAWSSANSQWEPLTPPGDIEGVSAGTGLSGGGTSGTVTLNISNTGVTAATYGTASRTPTFTVNAQGQLTSASQQNISITASQVSDFNEALEDRIGSGFIVGGSNITVTYDDAGNSFTIDADQSGDVTAVVAGSGLTGGGSSGDLTLNIGAGTGITVNTDNVAVNMGDFSTSDLAEGTNLYYTTARANSAILDYDGNISPANANITGTLIASGLTYPTSDGNINQVLTTDGSGALSFTDVTAIGGTITGVNAGAGLTGGGVAGTVTVNAVGGYGIDVNANDIEVANADIRGLFSAGGDLSYNASTGVFSFTNDAGDIEGVTAGFGLSGGGTTGTVSLALANADVRGLFSAGGDLSYNSSTGQFSFTNDAGDIESVTAGVGLSGGGSSGDVSLALDFSELTDMSSGLTGNDEIILNLSSNVPRRKAANEINLSIFNLDNTHRQAIRGFFSGSNGVNYNNTTGAITADTAEIRGFFSAGGDLSYNASTGVFSFTNDAGDIEGVSAGTGLTGGGTSGNVTLSLSHLGLENLSDPNDDRILFWDDSAGATGWLDAGTGISISGATMSVNMGAFDTGDLSEGTNQYYTVARANSAIDARVTSGFVDALNVDADTVDNLHASSFLRSDAADTHSGTITPNADNSIDLGSSSNRYNEVYAVTFRGTATSAQYADLAENYLGDANYEVGTVVEFGGDAEVTASSRESSPAVAGVVSTDPAYLMNAGLEGDKIVTVALRGRVPCKVYGPVRKGDVLIASEKPGLAKAAPFRGYQTPAACIVGKAISEHRGMAEGVVEILV